MIDLHASSSPNVQKIQVMLEEVGLPYSIVPVNVHKGEQYGEAFTALNPNRKVPVIVDHDGPGGRPFTVFESGAILIYLAEKTGMLFPTEAVARSHTLQWLMIQMTGVGPMFGQFNHFIRFGQQDSYAVERYTSEARRLYDLLDKRLGEVAWLGGADYSIADIATFPWIRTQARLFGKSHPVMAQDWDGHPNLNRWFAAIAARPAVQRALTEIDRRPSTLGTAEPQELDRYFGRRAFARKLG